MTPAAADPFSLIVPEAKTHPAFRSLRDSPAFAPARALIRELVPRLEDVDGNFVEQFQSEGFHPRLWELYLNTYFLDSYFTIGRAQRRPDFVLTKTPFVVCVEATTVNPTQGQGPLSESPQSDSIVEKVGKRIADYLPMKFGSALYSKLVERYWEEDCAKGRPLVIAIMDFHELAADKLSMADSSAGLGGYLYGIRQTWDHDADGKLHIDTHTVDVHSHGGKEIPSAFFSLPGAEHISAVMFSNSATISKFNRMGFLKGYDVEGIHLARKGVCMDLDLQASKPLQFGYMVGDPKFPEPWGQGLDVFHNPRAETPLHDELFPDSANHRFDGQNLRSKVPDFHPLVSVTFGTISRGQGDREEGT